MTGLAPMPTGPIRRIAFLGTPRPAALVLDAICDAGFDVPLVVTRPDKRRGRGGATSPSEVKSVAERRGLRVSHRVDDVLDVDVDLGVVVAYGALIKPHVLARRPMVNLHFSLLPRWRGAAPVERALLAGDERTGVCLMQLEEGLDTGGVFAVAERTIASDDTADTLRDALVALGTDVLLDALTHGFGSPTPQLGEPTYAAKLTSDDLLIDWNGEATSVLRQVRIGGAWTSVAGRRLKIHRAAVRARRSVESPGTCTVEGGTVFVATGGDDVELVSVQPEGRAAMDASAWANGARPHGAVLGR